MILHELAGLARREGLVEDPDYEPKPVRWVIAIGPGGKFLGTLLEEGEDDRGKSRPKVRQVPRSPVRTSGSAANFLVDKAEYALGFDPDENPKKVKKLATHRSLFAEYVKSALGLAPGDPGLLALLAFLGDDSSVSAAVEEVRGRAAANDLFAFRYRDGDDATMIHDRDAVRAAWKALRHPSGSDAADRSECLVCGERSIPVGVHPLVKRVPGGSTSGVSFISANAPAFESYGFQGNQIAPICRSCADSYGTALNRLFHPQYTAPDGDLLNRRSFKLADDTAVIYWASGAAEHAFMNELGDLEFYDAEHAGRLFAAVRSGKSVTLDDPTPFHALIVTGGQGRATIRNYYQTTVGRLAGNLKRYFDDVAIVKRFPNSPEHPALSWLVRSLAAQGKYENVAPNLAGLLILAVFDGSPFPRSVLAAALARIRSEPENPNKGQTKHTRERMALIRAALNRQFRPREAQPDAASPRIRSLITREIPPMLDPSCKNNAYCLGRLFAVLEKLQADAIGSPGSTITDRFYGAASATPAAVFASLLRKAQHHIAKLGGAFYPKVIQEVLDLLEPGSAFPSTLGLEEQGLFALGFYHQKASLWRGKEKDEPGTEGEVEQEVAGDAA